ncbi:MAG TPA: TonB-dependent receptor [Steroidobacter sp.]|uniref:TonB-dependent receptor domain-containing protein n=1 Tax=Steroidobacter sp. TaxID=1978227 RepID=UPI002ED895AA
MSTSYSLRRAVQYVLLTSATAAVAFPTYAQDAENESIQEVVVTGSRISSPNMASISPVSSVSAEDIKVQGSTRIEDIMNRLPQVFAAQGSNVSNDSDGTATVNLRGLGSNRTLVLVNGRRLGPGDPNSETFAADLNQIPTALVQRVEVLTGGASSVYGADAVGGVVNFIMDTKFEGVKIEANYSFYEHENDNAVASIIGRTAELPDDSVRGGYAKDFAIVMGSNFADDKGNATFYATYRDVDAVLQGEYDYSSCTLNSGDTFSCGGSGTSFPARFRPVNDAGVTQGSYTLNPTTGALQTGTAAPYNFGPLNYYQRPDERYTAGVFTSLEVSEKAEVYGEFMFMRDTSVAQIAPSGVFGDTFTVHCSNPLWSAAQFNAFCGSQGLSVNDTVGITVNRRNVEGGGRQQELQHTSYRTVFGVRGDINDAWTYDAYGQYGTTSADSVYMADLSISRTGRALDVVTDPTTGSPVCQSVLDGTDTTCVPYNIWTLNGVTPDALAYVQNPLLARGSVDERVVNASVTGDLTDYGVKLPSADSGVIVNVGLEWREEKSAYLPDGSYQTGDGAGQGGATLPLAGGYNVKEIFTEARVPLVSDKAFVQSLSAELGYRYSDYSTDWNTDTYKFGVEYSPIEDIRLRASYQNAVRVPNVADLFNVQQVGLRGTVDPCAGDDPVLTLEQCARTGVTSGTYGNIEANPAAQYNGFIGGNTEVEPETAKTFSFGVALQPSFAPGLRVQIDYFDIKIEDAIQNPNADFTLLLCALNGDPALCSKIQRDVNGSLFETDQGFVVDTLENIGEIRTKGFDFDASYGLPVGSLGDIQFAFTGTLLDSYEVTPQPGVTYDCAGLYGSVCTSGNPNGAPLSEWKHKMSATWNTPWSGLSLTLGWRYLDEVKRDAEDSNEFLAFLGTATGTLPTDSRLGSRSYVDLSAAMTLAERYTFRLGANNLLDKDPPLNGSTTCPTGPCNGNTWPQAYDALGRQIFMTATVEF